MTRHTRDALAVHTGEGEALWGSAVSQIKAAAADTGGQMTIIEVTEPPGAEAPLHVHRNEEEAPGMQRVAAIAGRYGCQVVGDA